MRFMQRLQAAVQAFRSPPRTRLTTFSPWQPITDPRTLKHLGKLGEETCELSGIIFRIIIQGMDECEPVTREVNRDAFEKEIADVLSKIVANTSFFGLDMDRILDRMSTKTDFHRGWFAE